ncbi:MAG: haloacid dehalogenase-like hydrolase, partial [Planctomycetota bacterium]
MALPIAGQPVACRAVAGDPLPSWRDGGAKRSIVEFVRRVTDTATADYVPPAERVAVFDNDGCLWVEQPVYTQAVFAFDRVKQLASRRPEWRDKEP